MIFADRHEAGEKLAAELLARFAGAQLNRDHALVVALPRGGVAVGFEIARQLQLPLDICVVLKVGAPSQPELAIGAVAEGDELVVNEDICHALHLTDADIARLAGPKFSEVQARIRRFRGEQAPLPVRNHTVILVDDGLATGATARSALQVLRRRGAERIILALPVCPADTAEEIHSLVDDFVVVQIPDHFHAVGQWYENFTQVTDEEVHEYLDRARAFLKPGK